MNNTKQISDAIKGLPDDTTICVFCSTCLGQKVIMDFLSGDDVVCPTCKGEDAHDLDIDGLKALVAENERYADALTRLRNYVFADEHATKIADEALNPPTHGGNDD